MNVKKTSKFITIAIIILLSLAFFACGANFEYDKDAALSKAKQAADCLNAGNYKALHNLLNEELQKNSIDKLNSVFEETRLKAGKFIEYNDDTEMSGYIKDGTKYIKVVFTEKCEKISMKYEMMLDMDMNIAMLKYATYVDKGTMSVENGVYIASNNLLGLPLPDFDKEAAMKKAKEATDLLNIGDYTKVHKMLSEDFQSVSSVDALSAAFSQIYNQSGTFINYNDNAQINEFKKSGEKYISILFTSQCKKNEMVYEVILDTNLKIVSLAYGTVYLENGTKKANATSISFNGIKYKFK
ncbi:MAG: DUF3887 domain-containing protein [Eubacteriaceae bacterium]